MNHQPDKEEEKVTKIVRMRPHTFLVCIIFLLMIFTTVLFVFTFNALHRNNQMLMEQVNTDTAILEQFKSINGQYLLIEQALNSPNLAISNEETAVSFQNAIKIDVVRLINDVKITLKQTSEVSEYFLKLKDKLDNVSQKQLEEFKDKLFSDVEITNMILQSAQPIQASFTLTSIDGITTYLRRFIDVQTTQEFEAKKRAKIHLVQALSLLEINDLLLFADIIEKLDHQQLDKLNKAIDGRMKLHKLFNNIINRTLR
ncbi:hypothetical protein EDM53_01960 [Rickettsiales endosymbiont of Peranema trichophorum]|uniref:hypothetical protein n=1 Tax=Rickettsiales endosymbiont of Peranema trichophorum TaxID=2486577 RepID=UPI001023732A|nr:hypothetical protein [Rickettsiales endosymbiont of Peranema trichophorum]RZI47420.1 hypothetical protein EDM53_01960 [Rickettsiales endosymbiont of Peranema trichophorum]